MKRLVRLAAVLFMAPFFVACASVMNPYEDSFSCPKTENGKCVSIEEAYKESLKPGGASTSDLQADNKEKPQMKKHRQPKHLYRQDDTVLDTELIAESSEEAYSEAVYEEMARLVKEPKTPMVAPPKIMRALLLPYKGRDGELFMYRYIYFFIDEPKWILDGYLNPDNED